MSTKQIPGRSFTMACIILAVSCSPAPRATSGIAPEPAPPASATGAIASPALTWTLVQPIVTPLIYRDMIIEKCTMKEVSPLASFMAELKAAGASSELLAQTEAEIGRLRESERKTEPEYVCTAELFDSTEKKAALAMTAWSQRKFGAPS